MIGGNSLWHLVAQSDVITKIVLYILLCMSIACWSLFLYKYILIRIKKRQLNKALVALKEVNTIQDLLKVTNALAGTFPGYFLSKIMLGVKQSIQGAQAAGMVHLDTQATDYIEEQMDQVIDELIYKEQNYVAILSTSAEASPLLGLFGTVWGLIHSFMRINELQSADIMTVAPGIAEALITTLAGLLVAIPAVIMTHYISRQIYALEYKLMVCAQKCSAVLIHFRK